MIPKPNHYKVHYNKNSCTKYKSPVSKVFRFISSFNMHDFHPIRILLHVDFCRLFKNPSRKLRFQVCDQDSVAVTRQDEEMIAKMMATGMTEAEVQAMLDTGAAHIVGSKSLQLFCSLAMCINPLYN